MSGAISRNIIFLKTETSSFGINDLSGAVIRFNDLISTRDNLLDLDGNSLEKLKDLKVLFKNKSEEEAYWKKAIDASKIQLGKHSEVQVYLDKSFIGVEEIDVLMNNLKEIANGKRQLSVSFITLSPVLEKQVNYLLQQLSLLNEFVEIHCDFFVDPNNFNFTAVSEFKLLPFFTLNALLDESLKENGVTLAEYFASSFERMRKPASMGIYCSLVFNVSLKNISIIDEFLNTLVFKGALRNVITSLFLNFSGREITDIFSKHELFCTDYELYTCFLKKYFLKKNKYKVFNIIGDDFIKRAHYFLVSRKYFVPSKYRFSIKDKTVMTIPKKKSRLVKHRETISKCTQCDIVNICGGTQKEEFKDCSLVNKVLSLVLDSVNNDSRGAK